MKKQTTRYKGVAEQIQRSVNSAAQEITTELKRNLIVPIEELTFAYKVSKEGIRIEILTVVIDDWTIKTFVADTWGGVLRKVAIWKTSLDRKYWNKFLIGLVELKSNETLMFRGALFMRSHDHI